MFSINFVYADTENKQTTESSEDEIVEEKIQAGGDVEFANENTIYKILYQNLSEDYDRLAATIYWAIGTIATVMLVIIGSGVYLNVKIYKAEFKLLENELKADIKENAITSQKKIEEAYESRIMKSNKELQDKLSKYEALFKGEIQNATKKLRQKIIQVESDLYRHRVQVCDVIPTRIRYLIQAVEVVFDNGDEHLVTYNLGDLIKILDDNKGHDTYDRNLLIELAKKISGKYETHSKDILSSLDNNK